MTSRITKTELANMKARAEENINWSKEWRKTGIIVIEDAPPAGAIEGLSLNILRLIAEVERLELILSETEGVLNAELQDDAYDDKELHPADRLRQHFKCLAEYRRDD